MPDETQGNGNESQVETTNSIKLSRSQKGTYGWEIKVRWPLGAAAAQTLADIKTIDDKLQQDYPTGGE